ncbi:efflux RND transporter periplasmic adaptor subunit [Undibacterium pigrum]|uniref:Macrolide-specific efflux system membrane fusion protein n=1 Tax=Undibacterium pigrum TaxID=401470 RepID=A0A318IT09_9BURK|nr:efflux RND transporter periplasmic adaptor subunit [Undibacterium pigrum]PXX37760.1 macrolide-specific efflux system membrane fusion protein [Undibacterium pigrum]
MSTVDQTPGNTPESSAGKVSATPQTPQAALLASPPGPPGKPPGRRFKPGTIIAIIIAVILLILAGIYAYRQIAGGDDEEKWLTAVVQKADIEDAITATGSLQPKDFVDVGTQVSGQLKILHVEVGAVVKAKDLLAEIDPTVYLSKADADRAQLRNQTAQLADKQAQLQLAELQLTRQKNLMREQATTEESLQTAEAQQRSAVAQVAAIKAQMQQTESTLRGDDANLSFTKIYAPIAGTVVSQTARQGQTLNSNQQAPIIMRIADLSIMTVQAQVSEADVGKLKLGMDVYFTTLGGSTRRYYGKLRQISPTPNVVNNVVLYDALFEVPNTRQTLLPQMTAQVFFVLASAKDAIFVPLTALHAAPENGKPARAGRRGGSAQDPRGQFKDGKAMASVMDKDGKVSERAVQVGVMTRVSAQILSGLEVGEKVVVGTKSAPATAAAPQSGGPLAGNNQRGGGGPR